MTASSGRLSWRWSARTAPRQHYPSPLARLSWPRQFHRHYRELASLRFGVPFSGGFRKNPNLAVEFLFLPLDGWILPDSASVTSLVLGRRFASADGHGHRLLPNPNYHLPSDTIDTLDFTFMAQLVKSLELTLLDLPPAPTNS